MSGEDQCLVDRSLQSEKPDQISELRISKNEFPSGLSKKMRFDDLFPFLVLREHGTVTRSTLLLFSFSAPPLPLSIL